ncbi:hypothetical protein B0T10DRAFT_417945 [Thelonectria olida]|uniref:Uncharacterized protein n=1 Tax=Thelonectria olida TaxID=1576542 RepID=A0A9P8VQ23_9HYPO|nr:hypothetical protein B0T10DRAFT_417945 [Thelonectria olida]
MIQTCRTCNSFLLTWKCPIRVSRSNHLHSFIFLDFCTYGFALAATRLVYDDSESYYSDAASIIRHLRFASAETSTTSRFFDGFSDIFVFLMFVSLGSGILLAQTGSPSSFAKPLKFVSLGISAVLAILLIAYFGLRTHFYSVMYGNASSSYGYLGRSSQFQSSRQLDFAFRVLVFILALGVVAQSIMVKVQTKGEPRVSSASHIFIACAGLWLLRTVYGMASMAASVNLNNVYDDPEYHNYYEILDVVFSTWPLLILLSVIFGLGYKKANGLWSTEQPFMTQRGNAVSPWGFNYDPNQVAAPVMAHQSQAPPMQQQSWPQYQQQQPYYPQPGHNGMTPQYAPAQEQTPVQQPFNTHIPVSQTRSPPPHEDTMGFNHQANGATPQTTAQSYYEKSRSANC